MSTGSTKNGCMRFGIVSGVFISVIGPKQWDDAEWNEFNVLSHALSAEEPAVPRLSLTVTTTVVPTPKQRKAATDSAKKDAEKMLRIAVVTDSAVLRGILTAFGWAIPGPELRAFRYGAVPSAIAWLGQVQLIDEDAVMAMVMRLRQEASV